MTLKNFRLYYAIPVIYYSWYNLTNKRNSGVVLAIWGSYYRSSKELGHYYLIRKRDITPDLGPILFTRLGTLASYKVVLLLVSLKLYTSISLSYSSNSRGSGFAYPGKRVTWVFI